MSVDQGPARSCRSAARRRRCRSVAGRGGVALVHAGLRAVDAGGGEVDEPGRAVAQGVEDPGRRVEGPAVAAEGGDAVEHTHAGGQARPQRRPGLRVGQVEGHHGDPGLGERLQAAGVARRRQDGLAARRKPPGHAGAGVARSEDEVRRGHGVRRRAPRPVPRAGASCRGGVCPGTPPAAGCTPPPSPGPRPSARPGRRAGTPCLRWRCCPWRRG
ncbi:MAG: hypothetical protein KatS3mg043_1692 [Rhodothermaceae bacterium]|nr:MAG: hypothetical protein KatS3mg043_1692 [Rhodothermaceae bacterium]